MLGTNLTVQAVEKFLEKEGNILSFLYDELSEIGYNLNLPVPLNRERKLTYSRNLRCLDEFYNSENNPLFIELINLSCIGGAHFHSNLQ